MNIWLVNPFDPLPGEEEQLGRYAHLADALRHAGHDVVWWSSTFSHRFKRPVDIERVMAGASRRGITVHLVPTPAYRANVSMRRLWSHHAYGRSFRAMVEVADRPNLILASSPPLESAWAAVELGEAWGVPTIVDIQDQWPDNFARVLPRLLRPFGSLLLEHWYSLERQAYSRATGIIGVGQGYVDRGVSVGGAKQHTGVFPLGVSLAEVDGAIARGAAQYSDRWTKPDGQTWLLYSGSLSYNYDFLTIVRAAAQVKRRYGDRVRFIITGAGELATQGREIIKRDGITNVSMTGFLDFTEWAFLLSQADVGFNAAFPDALIYFPNKIFYYLAAGLAVLNTIPGQCADLVDADGCGLNYEAGDVDGCADVISRLVDDPTRTRAMGTAARRLAEERFDRQIIYPQLVRFLEETQASCGFGLDSAGSSRESSHHVTGHGC